MRITQDEMNSPPGVHGGTADGAACCVAGRESLYTANDALHELAPIREHEKRARSLGIWWQIIGFAALLFGAFLALIVTLRGVSLAATWVNVAQLALRNMLVIALPAACAKYAFTLGNAYTREALKTAHQLHAAALATLCARLGIPLSDVSAALSLCSKDTSGPFCGLSSAEFDPKLPEKAQELAAVLAGKVVARSGQ